MAQNGSASVLSVWCATAESTITPRIIPRGATQISSYPNAAPAKIAAMVTGAENAVPPPSVIALCM